MKRKLCFEWQTLFILLFVLLFVSACAPASERGSDTDDTEHTEEEREHEDDHAHEEDDEHERIPNNGAAIHILSPADGDTFSVDDEVTVEIELENFTLGEGNHWHIYVDGSSWGMVMGENMDDTLRSLEPGEHEISVYLSIDTHEELEDGDAVTIVVGE